MYAIGFCKNCFTGASRLIGPYPDRETAITAFNLLNHEYVAGSGEPAWYWGLMAEFPRLEGCEVSTPGTVGGKEKLKFFPKLLDSIKVKCIVKVSDATTRPIPRRKENPKKKIKIGVESHKDCGRMIEQG